MSINNQNTYLNIEDAHLRLRTGNVYAQGITIGGITVDPSHGLQRVSDTGNVTSNTLQFANATTGFTTTANATIGRDLTVTGNVTVSSNLEVGGANLFVDTQTSRVGVGTLSPNANLHVEGNVYMSSNLEVGGANLFVDTQNSRVGVGTLSPNANLHVEGNVYMSSNLEVGRTTISTTVSDDVPSVSWARSIGGTSFDYGHGIATDSAGNVYVIGYYSDSVTIGSTTLTSSSSDDNAFIAKYDTSGTVQWATSIGGSGNDEGYGIATDSAGNVYVIGYYTGSVTIGSIPLGNMGSNDVFVAKYDTSGTVQWARSIGGASYDYGNGIATDSNGNVYVIGYYDSSVTIGTITLNSAGSADAFVAKYDTSGTVQWARSIGGESFDYGKGIATDSNGNVFVIGRYSVSVTIGSITLNSTGSSDAFVAKYDTSGTVQWARSIGGSGTDYGYGIATDSNGNVYVTGRYTGSVTIGSTTLNSTAGSGDAFVAKYATSGTVQWATSIGGTGSDSGLGIATDSTGNVYVIGYYNGSVTIGSTTLNSAGSADAFVAKYDTSGTVQWALGLGGTANDYGYGIATDSNENVYVTGSYRGSITIGSTTLNSAGASDVFVAKYYSPPITLHINTGQLELAGDERIQEYPPRALTGYETLVEGHGVFSVSASSVRNSSWEGWEAFDGRIDSSSRWISTDTYTGTEDAYGGNARLYSSAPLGEYVVLKMPYPIKLNKARVYGLSGSPNTNNNRQGPERGEIWGSNDGVTWEHVTNYDFGDYQQDQWNEINNINSSKYYSQYGFIVTKKLNNTYTAGGATQGDYVAVTEIQYFGTPGPTILDKGSLSLTRSLDVPRVSRYDVDTETPRPEKLVVDFDTTVNSSPTDISGRGNHGTLAGANPYSAADKAFKFVEGTANYIKGDTGLTGNFIHSISMWFNASHDGQLFWTGINANSGDRINIYFSDDGGYGGNTTTPQIHYTFKGHTHYVNVNPNQWYHLVCTYSGTDSSNRKIYLDGVETGADTATDGTGATTHALNIQTSTFYLSQTNAENQNTLTGKISNFKLYSVALEPSEVKKLYRLGRTGRSMVISDTAVGIGKAPEAQLDVRGVLKASVGLFPDKPFFACEAYRYGLKDNDTTQTLYWHAGATATLSSPGTMSGSRWKLGSVTGNHTYKTNNVQLVRVLNDSSSETSGVRVPYDGYYHLTHQNRTISTNVGASFVIYSPRHNKYIQTSMNGYRVPWGGNAPGSSGTNSNSVHTSLYLEAGDVVIYIFHNRDIADSFLSGSYEQFVSLVML